METLQQLVTYLEAIPSEKWVRGAVDNNQGGHCVVGHINYHLNEGKGGSYSHEDYQSGSQQSRAAVLLRNMGVDIRILADVNNGYQKYSDISRDEIDAYGNSPKDRVLNYLKKHHDTGTDKRSM